jgi:hypothetical protein
MADLAHAVWRTSSLSGGTNCVEVSFLTDKVALRDSKDRHGPILFFTHSEWAAFIDGVHRDEFALPGSTQVAPAADEAFL